MKPIFVCQHSPGEPPGGLAEALDAAGVPWVACHGYQPGAPSFDPAHHDGLVVLGGHMNADEMDRYPFLARERTWLRDAVERRVPVLGICLGAQLLARALDARVYRNPVPEIGWVPVSVTAEGQSDPVFSHLGPRTTVFHWHNDTFDLPAGAVHLAYSRDCPHQAFRIGPLTYGVQFHPEVNETVLADWVPKLEEPMRQTVQQSMPTELPTMLRNSRRLFAQWIWLAQVASM